MVELSGLTVPDELEPDGDIEIQLTGLRPVEKLYEELLIGDNPEPTPHPRIMRAREGFLPCQDIEQKLAQLNDFLASDDVEQLRDRELNRSKAQPTALASAYCAGAAQLRSQGRRGAGAATRRKLGRDTNSPLWRTVQNGLRCHWSPQQIAGKLPGMNKAAACRGPAQGYAARATH